ncbi:ABC transporter substrate-binding protein [Viridibacillus sp. FSL H7-0596]|uniref:ABC transporter substrate-binding protein n=1 Tax=Viridibacillus sp. FSL H7-0596 TaxID=1928923 RepID=UPI00096F6252|nr:ABC transporter substrate-binding protein [Viridibacillus sp. FSL H7-0596]OMC87890.1 ABC transporter substrate-binding protein [Viridibacillus sp. FSL H7-0596]
MLKNKSIFLFCLLLIMFSIVMVACNKTEDSTSKQQNNENKEEKATRVVKTIHGDIEIPSKPKRIVVDGYLPTLLLLDEKPVGATDSDLENIHIQNLVTGIDSIGENSKEKILELNPDLIISANSENSAFEDFSKIAPTIIIPYETYKDAHEEVTAFGEMLGKEKQAQEWLASFDTKIEEQREKIKKVISANETVSIFGAYNKDFYIYGDGIYRGGQAIYKQLQLTPPEKIKKELIETGDTFKQISFEALNDYAGDYIFLDQSYGGKLDKKNSMWNSMDAVKNDRVFDLDPKRFWPYDPISVLAQSEEIADLLVSKNQEK